MISVVDRSEAGVLVVVLRGEHDVATAPALDAQLAGLQARAGGLVVDLGPAAFVDSSVIGTLLNARRRADEQGRGFAVVLGAAHQVVRRALETSGLIAALPAFDTRAEALAALHGEGAGPLVSVV